MSVRAAWTPTVQANLVRANSVHVLPRDVAHASGRSPPRETSCSNEAIASRSDQTLDLLLAAARATHVAIMLQKIQARGVHMYWVVVPSSRLSSCTH